MKIKNKAIRLFLGSMILFNGAQVSHANVLANAAHENCSSPDNNSCWQLINESNFNAILDCNHGNFGMALAPRAIYSVQFDAGWGDGLGYPQPGTYFQCEAYLDNGQSVKFDFKTLDWGDRVQFQIKNKAVVVTLRPYWNNQVFTFERQFHY